jgi:hypothetical protein
MNSQITETVGFLSRWVLLAGALCLLGAVGVLAGWSVGELGSGPQIEMVLPDSIVSAETRFHVAGRAIPLIKDQTIRGIIANAQGQPTITYASNSGYCYIGHRGPPPGRLAWDYDPLPFGRAAFAGREPVTVVCPKGRPVTLVDLRLLGETPEDIGRRLPRWDAVLAGRTELGYVHLGPIEAYYPTRAAVRSVNPRRPVVMEVRSPGEWKPAFQRILRYLRKTPGDRIRIITADAGVAMWASRQGFATHMIGPSGSIVSPPENLRLYSDMQMFEESLAGGAINQ